MLKLQTSDWQDYFLKTKAIYLQTLKLEHCKYHKFVTYPNPLISFFESIFCFLLRRINLMFGKIWVYVFSKLLSFTIFLVVVVDICLQSMQVMANWVQRLMCIVLAFLCLKLLAGGNAYLISPLLHKKKSTLLNGWAHSYTLPFILLQSNILIQLS